MPCLQICVELSQVRGVPFDCLPALSFTPVAEFVIGDEVREFIQFVVLVGVIVVFAYCKDKSPVFCSICLLYGFFLLKKW